MAAFTSPDRSGAKDPKFDAHPRSRGEEESHIESISCVRNSGKQDLPCLWMQAGIVRRKSCTHAYHCHGCRFESALRRTAAKNKKLRAKRQPLGRRSIKIVGWEDRMKALPLAQRPCIHSMKQQIRFRSCTNEYRCGNCDFDQYFHDEYKVHAVVTPVDLLEVEGFKIPQGYYLHQGHAWAKVEEGSCVRVGVDDFASRLLGPLDGVEGPLMGKEVRKGEPHIALKRGTLQAGLLSPVSGVITAINSELRNSGNLVSHMPYSEGWVLTIHPENLRRDLRDLMISHEAAEFLSQEVNLLRQLIEEVSGPSATDGGQLGHDLYGVMPRLGWERIAKTFLRT